jgi:hypothetical protein
MGAGTNVFQLIKIVLAGGVSSIIGGIALSLLVAVISGLVTDLGNLSYILMMLIHNLPLAMLISGAVGALLASPVRQKFISSKLVLSIASLVILLLSVASTSISLHSPRFWLRAIEWTDNQDPQTRALYVKRLVAIGPSAVEPVIAEIGRKGTRSRSTWQLNVALKGLGQPAHQQLLNTIDAEPDDLKRIPLIDSLQETFADFSRLHLYLKSLQQYPGYARTLESQLQLKLWEEVPPIFTSDTSKQFNPNFIRWYQNRTKPKGPFPLWRP